MAAWSRGPTGGHELEAIDQMSVHELRGRNSIGLQILDVRAPEEWEAGHIPGAHYIFLPELKDKCTRLSTELPVAVYCDSGYRASIGASQLKACGFADVSNVPGSWKAWKAQKYPVDHPREDKKASDTDREPQAESREKVKA
jgi:hydroxyacylglutathione hydrolase